MNQLIFFRDFLTENKLLPTQLVVSTAIQKIICPVLSTELTTHGMVSKFINSQSLNRALNLLTYRSSVTQNALCFVGPLLTVCFKPRANSPTSLAQSFAMAFAPAVAHRSLFSAFLTEVL